MSDAADKGTVNSIIERRRKTKKDKLYVHIDTDNDRVIVGGKMALKIMYGSSIIVLEDEFKSSYDCSPCEGTGEIVAKCPKCDGKGKNRFEVTCNECAGTGQIISQCSVCNGRGALLEIPDQAKARPTSGVIQATGPSTQHYAIGDRVAYTGYTGHLIPFKNNTRIRIMDEKEVMCLVQTIDDGQGEVLEFIDKDTAYDLS